MAKSFDNVYAYLLWLKYLRTNAKATPLVGRFSEKQLQLAKSLDVNMGRMAFYAEAELLGEPGVDLIAAYKANIFQNHNALRNAALSREEEGFNFFLRQMQLWYTPETWNRLVYLESDLTSGSIERPSVFVSLNYMMQNIMEPVVVKYGMASCYPAFKQCLAAAEPALRLISLGFMYGRYEPTMRVVLYALDLKPEAIMDSLKRLGDRGKAFAAQIEPYLRAAAELDIFEYIVDLDLAQDGTIKDFVGLELLMKDDTVIKQQRLFQTEAYAKLLQLLQDWHLADARVNLVADCVFAKDVTDPINGAYHVNSGLSHFKLRWKEGKALPAKVYLQLKTCALS